MTVVTNLMIAIIRDLSSKRMTYQEIAQLLGVHKSTVGKYKSDRQIAGEQKRQRKRTFTEAQLEKRREAARKHYEKSKKPVDSV